MKQHDLKFGNPDLGPEPKDVKIIWTWCEVNVKIMRKCAIALFSYLFHIIFILFLHFGTPKRRRAGHGRSPLPPLWSLGQGVGPQNVKLTYKWYEIHMKIMWSRTCTWFWFPFHIIFICIFISFWARGPDRGGAKVHICCNIQGQIFQGRVLFPGRRSTAGKRHWAHPAHQNRKNMDASKCINNYVNLYSIDSQSCKINETSLKIIWKQWNMFQNWMKYCEIR